MKVFPVTLTSIPKLTAQRVSHVTISELWPLPPRNSDWHLHGNLNIECRTSKKKDYEYKCQSQSCSSIDNIVASGCPCVIKKKGLIVTLAAMQLILRVMTWVSWFWLFSSRLWCWVVMMACSYAWLWRSYVSLCLRARSQPVQMPKIDLVHKSVHMLPREFFFFFCQNIGWCWNFLIHFVCHGILYIRAVFFSSMQRLYIHLHRNPFLINVHKTPRSGQGERLETQDPGSVVLESKLAQNYVVCVVDGGFLLMECATGRVWLGNPSTYTVCPGCDTINNVNQ